MKTIAFLLVVVGACSVSLADQYPPWSELQPLFGESKDSEAVTLFVAKWELKEITKGPSGSYFPDNSSYSLLYRQSKIETIILDVLPSPPGQGEEHWTEYRQELPFGILASDTEENFSKRFGKPISRIGTTWSHNGFSVWAHFNSGDGKLAALYISEIEKKKP